MSYFAFLRDLELKRVVEIGAGSPHLLQWMPSRKREEGAQLPAAGIVSESEWPRCAVIACLESVRQVKGKPLGMEQRCYIASRHLTPAEVAEAVRSHEGIENQLHWVLDVTMKADASTGRKDNAPENLSLLKKIVLNLLV